MRNGRNRLSFRPAPGIAAVALIAAGCSSAVGSSPSNGSDAVGWYTMAAGDSVSGIARSLGVDPMQLLKLNPGMRLEQLGPGDRIKVPCPTASASASGAATLGRGHVPAPTEEVRANVPDDAEPPTPTKDSAAVAQPAAAPIRPAGCR